LYKTTFSNIAINLYILIKYSIEGYE